MWFTYTKEYYSAIKKNEIMPLEVTQLINNVVIVSVEQ